MVVIARDVSTAETEQVKERKGTVRRLEGNHRMQEIPPPQKETSSFVFSGSFHSVPRSSHLS